MNQELITEKLIEHDKRLDKHDNKLDALERNDAINEIKISELCKSLDSLTNIMKWFIGICVTTLLGFFIYTIEQLIK